MQNRTIIAAALLTLVAFVAFHILFALFTSEEFARGRVPTVVRLVSAAKGVLFMLVGLIALQSGTRLYHVLLGFLMGSIPHISLAFLVFLPWVQRQAPFLAPEAAMRSALRLTIDGFFGVLAGSILKIAIAQLREAASARSN